MSDPMLPPGSNFCQCAACGEYFGGVKAFELHRVGPATDRSCLAPSVVSDRKNRLLLRKNERGYWVRDYKLPPAGGNPK